MCGLPFNMKSSSHKTWQTSLLFLKPLHMQNVKRKKLGGQGILCPPRLKKWGGHVPRIPHQIAPMNSTYTTMYKTWACAGSCSCFYLDEIRLQHNFKQCYAAMVSNRFMLATKSNETFRGLTKDQNSCAEAPALQNTFADRRDRIHRARFKIFAIITSVATYYRAQWWS